MDGPFDRRLLSLYCGHTDCHNGDPDKPACQQIQECLCYLRATLKVTAAQPPATCEPYPVTADGSDGALPENGRGNEGHQLIHTYYRAAPPPKGAGQGAEAKGPQKKPFLVVTKALNLLVKSYAVTQQLQCTILVIWVDTKSVRGGIYFKFYL